ncbi:MAG: MAPEG family protein [Alphaproteobacteria bacterium]|nr:MAPEG family protein [Alphaproteobacteria bacterium]
MLFQITSLYAGLGALFMVFLSIRVIAVRRSRRIGLESGGDPELARRIRVHGNACETLPIGLIVLALVEATGGQVWLVHALGAALIVGRLAHFQGLTQSIGASLGRTLGMVLTFTVLIVGGLYLVETSALALA